MANIRQFDTGNLALRPSETGVEAAAGAARRIGAFYNQRAGATDELARNTEQLGRETGDLGNFEGSLIKDTGNRAGSAIQAAGQQYVAYEDHKEISKGAAVASDMFVNLEKQWNDTLKNADPNDPSVAAKFNETVLKPTLDKFQNGDETGQTFTTEKSQQYAEGIVDRYRQHFATKIAADMSTMAGIAAKQNATQTINSLSSAVYLDPSSLDTSIDVLKHSAGSIVDSSPTIDAETGAKVKAELNQKGIESLVKSAVSGMIEKNPGVDLDAIQKKYPEYINGGELKMFQKAAQTQAKVDAYHDKSAALAQRQLADQNVHADAAKLFNDNVSINPQTNEVTINPQFFKDVLAIPRNNPNAPSAAATAHTYLDWGQSQLNKERKVVTDPAAASAIDSRMFTSDNPTSKMDILQAEAAGKLTRSDAEIRTKIIDQRDKVPSDPQFKFAMDGAKELIEGRSAGEKSLQAGKYASFMQQFLGDYQRQKAAGTLPPNALSLSDPNSLISKSMEAYKSPLAAAIGGNGGIGPAPRNDTMPAIPAASARPPGSIYDTPRGKMKWTGTGWVQP